MNTGLVSVPARQQFSSCWAMKKQASCLAGRPGSLCQRAAHGPSRTIGPENPVALSPSADPCLCPPSPGQQPPQWVGLEQGRSLP